MLKKKIKIGFLVAYFTDKKILPYNTIKHCLWLQHGVYFLHMPLILSPLFIVGHYCLSSQGNQVTWGWEGWVWEALLIIGNWDGSGQTVALVEGMTESRRRHNPRKSCCWECCPTAQWAPARTHGGSLPGGTCSPCTWGWRIPRSPSHHTLQFVS